jgi:hypothetical protein
MVDGTSKVRPAVEHPLNSGLGNRVSACRDVTGHVVPDLLVCK